MASTGRQSKTSPRSIATAQRRAQALKLRLAGARYDDITQQLGYSSRGAAVQDVQRALVATVQEPADELRALEVQRLDMLWQTALRVLTRQHVTVSNGKVVHLDGSPVKDDAPVLAAIDRLLKIQERRARLLGLDAPAKHEVVTLDAVEAEIRRLNEELERAAASSESEDDGTGEFDGVEAGTAAGAAATSD
jgi:hypothetical protein